MSTTLDIYTYEYLLQSALDLVPNSIDKRQGSIIYDALAPACYELALAYMEMKTVLELSYADTAIGQYLDRRCEERGITRYAATKAIRKGEFSMAIPIGSRFKIQDITYITTELISGTNYELQCETAGIIGNSYTGDLMPISNIEGLDTAILSDIISPGQEEETDDELRARYFEDLQSQPFGGNIAEYKTKTKLISTVGGCKVYPVWNGGGTVKLIIQDSNFDTPTPTIIDEVKNAVDPLVGTGTGLGFAPIGHSVTVVGTTDVTVNVSSTFTFSPGYIWADVETYAEEALEAYLLSLRQEWDSYSTEAGLVVRITQIESSFLSVNGIIDVAGTTINSSASNLTLSNESIPVLGTVSSV